MGGREGRREEKEVLGCATSGRKLRARDSGRSRVFRRSASRLAATGDLVRGVLVLLVLSLLFRDLLFTCLLGRHMRLELCRWLPLTATAQHSMVCASARSPGSRDAPRPYRAPMAGSFGGGRSSPTRSRKALATEAQSEGGGSRGHVSSTCLPHSSVCQRSQSQLLCLCSRSSSGNRGRAYSEPEYPSVGSSVRS